MLLPPVNQVANSHSQGHDWHSDTDLSDSFQSITEHLKSTLFMSVVLSTKQKSIFEKNHIFMAIQHP